MASGSGHDDLPREKARVFKALGHPLRLAIVESLRAGEKCVSDIVGDVGAEQSSVSRHLGQLLSAALLTSRRRGHNVYYCLAKPDVLDLLASVQAALRGDGAARDSAGPRARTDGSGRGSQMAEQDQTALAEDIARIAQDMGKSRNALMDVARAVQKRHGCISDFAIERIAEELGLHRVEVEDVVSFFHFLGKNPTGSYTLYLNNSITSIMSGFDAVKKAFEDELGIAFGETTADGAITLRITSCIGMNDQEPAALLNGVVFTNLTPAKAKDLCEAMRRGDDPQDMVKECGEGNNSSPAVRAGIMNNIRRPGPVIFAPFDRGKAVREAVAMNPEEVISVITNSRLRGRGGAGFPTGMKWGFCRKSQGAKRYVICNADEGEPGTFKDRVLLTEIPDLLFDGMTVTGWAVGADEGILYLRGEYEYLREHLENVLTERRKDGLLGVNAAGKQGFNFDIRVQIGAGAYICGEESALIESMEGKRGAPRDRPPFPVEVGYNRMPTVVNNVETLCAAARIMVEGAGWFSTFGTDQSRGTKVLSISGDCEKPGIYEVPFGISIKEIVEMAGASEPAAVQVGGPSGTCIGSDQFDRVLSFEDLATGGAFIIFGPDRNILDIVHNFMEFFCEESCGWCVPCRVGNKLLKSKLEKVMAGRGTERDLEELAEWGAYIKTASRCGFGQTSPNPILTTLENLRPEYEKLINQDTDFMPEFDLQAALHEASEIAGHPPENPENA